MSISLSSGFSSQFSQNRNFPDRQNYGRNSVTDKVHEFSKDQMEHLITSMDMMSKDIRSHLLDLQTMPGATNAYSQLQPKTEQFESIVEDKIRSSFQRLSPVIMQGNLYSETVEPYYSTSEWKYQTPPSPPSSPSPRELHPIIIGERCPERSEYKFCNPSNVTKESNMQPQTNSERCRYRLPFERNAEGHIGSKNINSFTNYDHSYTNQTPDTNELDGSHFAACLDQGLKKSFSKEKSCDASLVKRNGCSETSMAPGSNSKCVGTELVSESEEKQEEPTDSTHNIILKDLVSQAAQLLNNNDSDLNIDTDSMVDSLWSEIKEAFSHNIEKVFKDVNTSEFLSKLSQDAKCSKVPLTEKKSPKVSNTDTDESDISVCDKNPEGHDKNKKDDDMVDDALPLPSASSSASTSSAEDCCFDYSSRKSRNAKQPRCEKVKDKMLWNSYRRRRNKKREEEEEEVDEEEEEDRCFSPFISGGILNQKRINFDQLQPRKNYASDQDQRLHHKHKGNKKFIHEKFECKTQ